MEEKIKKETENKEEVKEEIKMLNPNSVKFCKDCPIDENTGERIYCSKCASEQIGKLKGFTDKGFNASIDD